jgi:hypothetical protein
MNQVHIYRTGKLLKIDLKRIAWSKNLKLDKLIATIIDYSLYHEFKYEIDLNSLREKENTIISLNLSDTKYSKLQLWAEKEKIELEELLNSILEISYEKRLILNEIVDWRKPEPEVVKPFTVYCEVDTIPLLNLIEILQSLDSIYEALAYDELVINDSDAYSLRMVNSSVRV